MRKIFRIILSLYLMFCLYFPVFWMEGNSDDTIINYFFIFILSLMPILVYAEYIHILKEEKDKAIGIIRDSMEN